MATLGYILKKFEIQKDEIEYRKKTNRKFSIKLKGPDGKMTTITINGYRKKKANG